MEQAGRGQEVSSAAPIPGCGVLPPLKARAKRPAKGSQAPPARSGAGRWQTLNAFVDATLKVLTGAQAKVWFILFRDTKKDGLVRASDAELARRAGTSPRSVFRARRRLIALGLLEVVRTGGLFKGPSVYRVRALTADTGGELHADIRGNGPRTPVSYIPERDQNECPYPGGSGTQKQKKGAAARHGGTP